MNMFRFSSALAFAVTAGSVALAQVQTVNTATGAIKVENVAGGLEHPWGMAFLPDGRMLVTELPGDLVIVSPDGTVSPPIQGTPEVFAQGQGGLMDVALDPDFAENQRVYLSFAQPGDGNTAGTALGHGRLVDDRIEDFEVIFEQEPKVDGGNHFGNRIIFSPQGQIYLALGERFKFEPAQDLSSHLGTIVRLNQDGSIPQDNPFVGQENAKDAIWSYGHRNIEAAAIHPDTGDLWVAEMGPMGGDELNPIMSGANYGWPVVSWGQHYSGEPIPDPPSQPDFADAVHHWTPVISPSGMIFYDGSLFPEWQGDAFIGGLSSRELVRVELDSAEFVSEERIPLGARIREVEQGPDGAIYVLTDQSDGNVWRISPLE
ncbi:PQQ-dependent sugar dehydrogenase [Pseudosulfitobacter koreensis]|uniref:PQQ-dependent sugar dehydrogenase n=1 Tax=Pseudosulfitobacter koreensis TaxID=2968472 RepID=A0ABT1YZN6_9RHOB|nr:PQQ-dependent sugar dehydrogenase [Pseudosulfitobacter koreense]MCR8826349.1 PQQ-dependent sugar dehydrogenase [Pseudosulfitobacter koreense]